MNKLNYDYTILTPFKLCVLENFPFIEADFDALTNYEIMCKMVEYMNSISKNQNLVQANMIELNNWFNNLDVQDEINNKLDQMAESGELQTIIASYINTNAILSFNTVSDLKASQNIINGSFVKTYGNTTYNDGKGAFYKIRTMTSSDVVDEINIISLTKSNTLIAEKMINYDINLINSNRTILIGDSYALDRRPNIDITGWAIKLKELMNLSDDECYIVQDNGGGFTVSGSDGTFEQALANLNISNKDTIKNIIVCGGLNDISATNKDQIKTSIQAFMSYCKNNYPNANVYIGMIGWSKDGAQDHQYTRYQVLEKVLPAYQECNEYDAIYLNGVENVMHNITEYYDESHPNQNMCNKLANYIYQSFKNGYASVTYNDNNLTFKDTFITTSYFSLKEKIVNNQTIIFDNNEFGSQINYNSNNPVIANNDLYVGDLVSKYITNVYTNQQIAMCPIILTDIENNKYQSTGVLYIKNYTLLHCHIVGSIQDGLTIKEVNLLNPYCCKPTIMQ